MKEKIFNEKTIKRLTQYHFILESYEDKGLEYISSPQISKYLNIDDSQVRKDIKLLNSDGLQKKGYKVKELKKNIETALSFKKNKNAVIIGAGNLGTALIKYKDLKNYGLNILALFDNNPLKVGMKLSTKEIFSMSHLAEFVSSQKVEIAILTVPREVSQEVADFVATSGIKCIWNFTPSVLYIEDKNIKVLNENLIGNFLAMVNDRF